MNLRDLADYIIINMTSNEELALRNKQNLLIGIALYNDMPDYCMFSW